MAPSVTPFAMSICSVGLLFAVLYSNPPLGYKECPLRITTDYRGEKQTHLHFYFHDIVSGDNSTVVKIAGANGDGGPYGFGTTMMADDALTEGPDRSSKLIGRAQGIYGIAARDDVALLMVMNYVFFAGDFNGSSITLLGRNHVMDDVREMPVVGGTGAFRLARGYALAHTVWFDEGTGDATVEYNVYLSHPERGLANQQIKPICHEILDIATDSLKKPIFT